MFDENFQDLHSRLIRRIVPESDSVLARQGTSTFTLCYPHEKFRPVGKDAVVMRMTHAHFAVDHDSAYVRCIKTTLYDGAVLGVCYNAGSEASFVQNIRLRAARIHRERAYWHWYTRFGDVDAVWAEREIKE